MINYFGTSNWVWFKLVSVTYKPDTLNTSTYLPDECYHENK